MKKNSPKRLQNVLESLHYSKNRILIDAFDSLLLIKKWPSIVGDKIAQVTIPLKGQKKTLIILSAHAIYSQELKFMEKIILEKIFSIFPKFKKKIYKMSFQTNASLFKEKTTQFLSDSKVETNALLHPQSPEYKTYHNEAKAISRNIVDRELRDLVIKFYIQVKAKENRLQLQE